MKLVLPMLNCTTVTTSSPTRLVRVASFNKLLNIFNSASFSKWTDTFFNLWLSASTLASYAVKGGGVAFTTAGHVYLCGVFF